MDRREALKSMAAGAAAPVVAVGSGGASEVGEPFCPERFETWDEFQSWIAKGNPHDYPTTLELRETDSRVSYGSVGWRWRASVTVWHRGDPTPRSATADSYEEAIAGVLKAGKFPAVGVWPAIKDRPFWAIRLHDGWFFYQTDMDGAYYTFQADGNYVAHKGAPKYLPQ